MSFAKTSILALAAVAVTAPAFADSASLARSVGVEPGVYSVEQLAELKAAQSSDDFSTVKFILDNPEGANAGAVASKSTTTLASASTDALAASVGVEPGVYSVSQLVALKAALDSDDYSSAAFIRANPAN